MAPLASMDNYGVVQVRNYRFGENAPVERRSRGNGRGKGDGSHYKWPPSAFWPGGATESIIAELFNSAIIVYAKTHVEMYRVHFCKNAYSHLGTWPWNFVLDKGRRI